MRRYGCCRREEHAVDVYTSDHHTQGQLMWEREQLDQAASSPFMFLIYPKVGLLFNHHVSRMSGFVDDTFYNRLMTCITLQCMYCGTQLLQTWHQVDDCASTIVDGTLMVARMVAGSCGI